MGIIRWFEREIEIPGSGGMAFYTLENQASNIVQIINRQATGGGRVYVDNRSILSTTIHALKVEQGSTGNFVRPYALREIYLITDSVSPLKVGIIEIQADSLDVVFNASQVIEITGAVSVQQPIQISSGEIEVSNDSGNPIPVSGAVTATISGTPAVTISGTPAVNAAISGTPTFVLQYPNYITDQVTAGGAGVQVVKASAGWIAGVRGDGTVKIKLYDGPNQIWPEIDTATETQVFFPTPIRCGTSIRIEFDVAGDAWPIFI